MDDYSLTHIPPQDIDCEKSIIASCLLYPEDTIKFIEQLKPNHFYHSHHKELFSAFVELYDNGKPTDLVTVVGHMKDTGRIEKVGGAPSVSAITDHPIVSDIDTYAQRVRDKYTLRTMIEASNAIQKSCYGATDSEGALDKAQAMINAIEPGVIKQPAVHYADVLDAVISEIEENQESGGGITGATTGFADIDKRLGGLQKSDLVLIAARPSMGKTALMLNMARNASRIEHKPVLIFSMEMSKEQLLLREICSTAGVNSYRVRNGLLTQKDWPAITHAAGKIAEWPVYIDDSEGMHYMDLRRRARKFASKHDPAAIFIDYLQLMKGDANQNREREISSISGALKGLAKELNLPVVALSQLNRKVEERSNKKPDLADLRDSGSLEQDADVVLFIYRDEVYNTGQNNPNRGTAEIICRKQRNGPIGTDKLHWDARTTSFHNAATQTKEV